MQPQTLTGAKPAVATKISERASITCHNCRRRRVKCDQLLPRCQKCSSTGLECMGYGKLIIWNNGIASRGTMKGKTFNEAKSRGIQGEQSMPSRSATSQSVTRRTFGTAEGFPEQYNRDLGVDCSLIDPLLQDLDRRSRLYISHFVSHVCQDMVIYDLPQHNAFSSLVKYVGTYPILRDMIIATSACHLFNHFTLDTRPSTLYYDALMAKHRALRMLRSALENMKTVDVNIVLAPILLSILFELIDSGKDTWKTHVDGAKALLHHLKHQKIYGSISSSLETSVANAGLISECIVLDIFGSTLSGGRPKPSNYEIEGSQRRPVLQLAEINNCFSFPAELLELIHHTSRHIGTTYRGQASQAEAEAKPAELIESAKNFDPLAWAMKLQAISPHSDLDQRVLIASAHKAAAHLFIWRNLSSKIPGSLTTTERHALISEIILHLAQINTDSHFFKATVWPCFIAGAETDDPTEQSWVVGRLRSYYGLMPWNYVMNVIEVLGFIWSMKAQPAAQGHRSELDWLRAIKKRGINYFVA